MSKDSDQVKERKKVTEAAKLGKAEGRWTMDEHKLFIVGLKKFGKNWKKLEGFIETRTSSQIRSHAQKYFNKKDKEQTQNENFSKIFLLSVSASVFGF